MTEVATEDPQAFEKLYGLYEQRVYHYICTLVRDPNLAEEVVGDVMLAVWQGARRFAHQSRVSTWIFGIARHKAFDALRRHGRHQQQALPLDDAPDIPDREDSPVEQIHREQLGWITRQAVAKLSPEHQEILRLVFYEELPYDEIATLLEIHESTVKTRVFYAKQQLKRHMDRVTAGESVL
ncbi:MAG: sigma-70 family RNA polymerase sigma factor [Nitrospiraceae bacterium]|nr:sigma-70 family RNA polymerase sigma factor [Nitrospiraceae bacterium]